MEKHSPASKSESSEVVELLPCPFCGSDDVDLTSYAEGHGTTYRVECECDVQGIQNDAIAAIALWNTRTPTPVERQGGEGAIETLISHTHHDFDCNKRMNKGEGDECDCGLGAAKVTVNSYEHVAGLVSAAREVLLSGQEPDDRRLDYIYLQADRNALAALRAALAHFEGKEK